MVATFYKSKWIRSPLPTFFEFRYGRPLHSGTRRRGTKNSDNLLYIMLRVSVAVAALSAVFADVPADEVTSIPNFANPAGGSAPLSKLYSGYLDAGVGKHHHYMYSASLNNPSTDPLVLWFK